MGRPSQNTYDADAIEPIVWPNAELHAHSLNKRFDKKDAVAIMRTSLETEFRGEIALVSSFGTQSATLLHMVSQVDKNTPVLFIETGKLFKETIAYQEQLAELLKLTNIQFIRPNPVALKDQDPHGALWMSDTDACCGVRKVAPLAEAIVPYKAWITGRKRYQGALRSRLDVFEADGDQIKINPLADWTSDNVRDYLQEHNLPAHPLLSAGYKSVGCEPCTAKTAEGGDERSGRWAGQSQKTECGIHTRLGSSKNSR